MTTAKNTHICIFTQSHVSRAPRVVKEANVYAEAGYRVTVYATWYDQTLLDMDRSLLHPTIVYKAGVNLLNWDGIYARRIRGQRLLGRLIVKYFNVQSKGSLGYGFKSYIKQLEGEQADVYIGHQEMGMTVAKNLIEKGKKVAFDFEDWHSKDLLPKDRAFRPIKLIEELEAYILKNAVYCYTTSEAMAKAMANYYQVSVPKVIYNSFFASQRQTMDGLQKDVRHHNTPSVFWFSQVIGEGRGLELLFEALRFVQTPFQLHLRGNISESYREKLKAETPKHVELYIHRLVPPDKLISRIAEYDLGLAFEERHPESRNYTITNKVFHYLQSGIPILATETAGQMEITQKAPNVLTIVERNPKVMAQTLDGLLKDVNVLKSRKEASWQAGKDIFAFENQASHLIRMLNNKLTLCNHNDLSQQKY